MCMTRIVVAALAAIGLSMTGEGTSAAEDAADAAPVRPAVEINSRSTFSLVRHPDRAVGAQAKGPVPAGLHVVDPAQGAPRIGGHASRRRRRRRALWRPWHARSLWRSTNGRALWRPWHARRLWRPTNGWSLWRPWHARRLWRPTDGRALWRSWHARRLWRPWMRGPYGGPGMRGAYGGPGMGGALWRSWHARRLWRPMDGWSLWRSWHARRSLWRSWDGRPWRPADELRLSSPRMGGPRLRRTPYGWTWLWWAAHGRRSVLRRPAHERTDLWRPAHGEASLWRA